MRRKQTPPRAAPTRKKRKKRKIGTVILPVLAVFILGYMCVGYFVPGVPLWMKKGFPVLPSNPGWEEAVEAWMNDPKKAIHDLTLWETLPETQP